MFIVLGKRRMRKISDRKTRHQIDLSVPSTDQTLSSESLLPSVQSPLSFTYENPTNSNLPMSK
jgi:hypothetical protein